MSSRVGRVLEGTKCFELELGELDEQLFFATKRYDDLQLGTNTARTFCFQSVVSTFFFIDYLYRGCVCASFEGRGKYKSLILQVLGWSLCHTDSQLRVGQVCTRNGS